LPSRQLPPVAVSLERLERLPFRIRFVAAQTPVKAFIG
jgi:hypothetical protein